MKSFSQSEENLFQQCLEIPPEDREGFVSTACPDNPELRESVLTLVRVHESQGGFLDALREDELGLEGWDDVFSDVLNDEVPANDPTQVAPPNSSSRVFMGMIALLLGVAGTVFWLSERSSTISIRPLDVFGSDETSLQIAVELQNELNRVFMEFPGVAIPRIRDQTHSSEIPAAPHKNDKPLNTDYTLEGDVQQIDGLLRIRISLVGAKENHTVWTNTFSRFLNERNTRSTTQSLVDHLANGLGQHFNVESSKLPRIPISYDTEALDRFGKGKRFFESLNRTLAMEALALFQEAVDLDPNFALAHVYESKVYLSDGDLSEQDLSKKQRIYKAKQALQRALTLDPVLPDAFIVEGDLKQAEGDRAGAKASYERSIVLDPDFAEGYYALANWGWDETPPLNDPALMEFMEDMRVLEEKAVQLEPMNPKYRWALAHTLEKLNLWDESMAQLEHATRVAPEFVEALRCQGYHRIRNFGRYDEAIPYLRKAVSLDPSRIKIMGYLRDAYESLGELEEAAMWTEKVMATSQELARIYEGDYKRYHGDQAGAAQAYRAILVDCCEDAINTDARRRVFNEDLRLGNLEEAQTRYYRYVTELFSEEPVVDTLGRALFGGELAAIFKAMGEGEQAKRLLKGVEHFLQDFPIGRDREFHEAAAFAVLGQDTAALDSLRAGVEVGYHSRLDLEDARFDSLRDYPEFDKIMSIFRLDMASQRARIRRMEQEGRLAPIPGRLLDLTYEPAS